MKLLPILIKRFLLTCVGTFLLPVLVQAQTTLISDAFNGTGNLNATTPGITTNGAAWAVQGGTYTESGGVLLVDMGTARGAALNLGSNYFTSHPGIYTLSATITMPTIASPGTEWISLGFMSTFDNTAMNSSSAGNPWLVSRMNGGLSVFPGPSATVAKAYDAVAGTYATGTAHTYSIILNTSLTNWTFDVIADGTMLDLNGASAGTSYTLATNPALQYVGLSVSGVAQTATVDNFILLSSVPEPSVCAMFVMSVFALGMLGSRRAVRS